MSKLMFRITLPILQLVAALLMFRIGASVVPPAHSDSPGAPIIVRVCQGVNAPALLAEVLMDTIDAHYGYARTTLFGMYLDRCLFFGTLVILWFVIGWLIDIRGTAPWLSHASSTLAIVLYSASLLAGIGLAMLSTFPFRSVVTLHDPASAIFEGLLVVWVIVLIAFPVRGLIRSLRTRRAGSS